MSTKFGQCYCPDQGLHVVCYVCKKYIPKTETKYMERNDSSDKSNVSNVGEKNPKPIW